MASTRTYAKKTIPAGTKLDPKVDFVVAEFEKYESSWADHFDLCDKIYDHWSNKPPKRDFDWQNQIHVPLTIEAEQTISPRLMAALFPTPAPFELVVEPPATEDQAIAIKSDIAHHFRVADVEGEMGLSMGQTTLFGTGYLETFYDIEQKWQVSQTGLRYKAITHTGPSCRFTDFFEMFPHPAKLRIGDGLPLIRRQFCDAEYLKVLAENPHLKIKNLAEALASESVVTRDSTLVQANGQSYQMKQREEYEILQYWGGWDVTYEQDKKVTVQRAVPHWILVVNREVLLRGDVNPFNHQHEPYIKMKLFSNVKPSWMGVGIGQVGYPTQERTNKLVNQRLDNVDLVLNKQGCYNGNDTLINVNKLKVSKPGQWHKVADTVTSLRWMETPDVTASSYQEEKIAKDDYRESTGATTPMMPSEEGQHRTAMGINLLQGAAGQRFKVVLKQLETDGVAEIAQQFLSMSQQFMTTGEWVQKQKANGAVEPLLVKPEMIQGKAVFVPTGVSETLNKEMQVGQLLRFKELTMNDPTINRAEINKRIAELLGFKDIQKFLTPLKAAVVRPGGLGQGEQEMIQRRLAEGATPEQIKLEIMGTPPTPAQPMPEGQPNG